MTERRYQITAIKPKGIAEDPKRCIAEVPIFKDSPITKQCHFNRGHGPGGLFCKTHAKKWIEIDSNKSSKKYLKLPDNMKWGVVK